MHKRLPLLALCLAALALGTTACDASGDVDDNRAKASASPSATASASPSVSASASPRGRGLKGVPAKFFLKTLRDNYPDLDRISDEKLVAHGDALCTIRGAALGEQFKKTMRDLDIDNKQASRITGVAHSWCRDKDDQLFKR